MPKKYLLKQIQDFHFLRNHYRLMLYFTIFLQLCCIATIVVLTLLKITTPHPPYFATTSDGRIIEIQPYTGKN